MVLYPHCYPVRILQQHFQEKLVCQRRRSLYATFVIVLLHIPLEGEIVVVEFTVGSGECT